jgi:starch synthase
LSNLQVESKAHVLKRRRENQHEFLYTLPVTPKAGEKLELYYNPDLTPLRGRPEIYVRGGFNRCGRHAHACCCRGCLCCEVWSAAE